MKTNFFYGKNLENHLCRYLLKKTNHVVIFYDSKLTSQKNKMRSKIKQKNKNLKISEIKIVANEKSKNLNCLNRIYQKLFIQSTDKKAVFVAIGGGVVGDITGFIASTYMRGVRWIGVPTTVLSQVDSSVGGKTGVNLAHGKNIVGCIYQPIAVFLDSMYLATLPERELVSGLGEILKYFLIDTKMHFPKFSKNINNKKLLLNVIKDLTPRCVKCKMNLVRLDERDEKGIRQILNLGHTFAHALESLTDYTRYRHGEAVIYGLKFCLIVSYLKDLIRFEDFREFMNLANRLPLPSLPSNLTAIKCYNGALRDKKSVDGIVKMVLVKRRGQILVNQTVDKKIFFEAVQILKEMSV